MAADAWRRHLAPGTDLDPADLTAAGSLPALWAARWAAGPSTPALRFEGPGLAAGERWLGSAQLEERSRDAARRLAAVGAGRGDRVLWSCAPSPGTLAAVLGALRLGAVVVPVGPAATRRELAHVVTDVRPAVAVLDSPERVGWVTGAGDPARGVRVPAVLDGELAHVTGPVGSAVPAAAPGTPPLDRPAPGDPAMVVYTSGTTGTPKGAVLTHANLLAGVTALHRAWRWEPDDRLVLALPLFHVHGLVAGLLGTLAAGASAVVQTRFDPAAVLAAAARPGTTMFFGVPTMYHRLVEEEGASALGRLRLCVSGSAPLAAALWDRVHRSAGAAVLERYGMTETLLTVSNPYEGERRPGTVGFPLPGVELQVEAPGAGAGEGDGAATGEGTLAVRGPSVFAGYWDRPAATAEVLGPDGWFLTGDVGSVDAQGYVRIHGRRGDLIISGGFNVYPAEVEDVLLRHPGVAEVAVTGTPSDRWGEVVTAWVVPAGRPPDTQALQAFARERLAPYKVPRLVRTVDALPRNAMGKVQRSALR